MELERYCVVDVETTGFSPTADRIVEIACALVDGERIVGSWATLVHPGMAIPPVVTAIHGITDAMVAQAPSSEWALHQARRFCEGRLIAAHCARFDLSFVGPKVGTRGLCTMRLARALFPDAPNHKNQTLRHYLGIDRVVGTEVAAHRALGDALVSAHVLLACRRRFRACRPRDSWASFVRSTAMVELIPTTPLRRAG